MSFPTVSLKLSENYVKWWHIKLKELYNGKTIEVTADITKHWRNFFTLQDKYHLQNNETDKNLVQKIVSYEVSNDLFFNV